MKLTAALARLARLIVLLFQEASQFTLILFAATSAPCARLSQDHCAVIEFDEFD